MTNGALTRVRGPLLGGAVFAAAVLAWEALARADGSFLFPTASVVLGRAWHVWPTTEFLTTVASSPRRLAAGYVLGASVGVGVGLLMGHGSRRGARLRRDGCSPVHDVQRHASGGHGVATRERGTGWSEPAVARAETKENRRCPKVQRRDRSR